MSIAYYDGRAEEFFRDTASADMAALQARFLRYLTPGARILDGGCGSGRDSLAFARAGFRVTAFDASSEMVRLASANTGLPVIKMAFAELGWDSAFDGVWACASLLHVPRADLPSIAGRLLRALVPGGIFFFSFKLGEGDRQAEGRHFTDMTERSLASLSEELGAATLELWQSRDARPKHEREAWVSVIGRCGAYKGCHPNTSLSSTSADR